MGRSKAILSVVLLVVVLGTVLGGVVMVRQPQFGGLPQGEELNRVQQSPNYQNGAL